MSAGPCPKCGGRERRLLAPGYFECMSRVLRDVVPPAPPGVLGDVLGRPLYGPCGYRYQAGPQSADGRACECGMFAVGECQACGKAVCGQHGAHSHGRFVCVAHIREAEAEASASAEQRQRAERAAIRESLDRALVTASDSFERLVLAAHWVALEPPKFREHGVDSGRLALLFDALQEAGDHLSDDGSVWWDQEALCAWFAQGASERGVPTVNQARERETTTVFGKTRRRLVSEPAWIIEQAEYKGRDLGKERYAAVALFGDGHVAYAYHGQAFEARIDVRGLADMAVTLGLV